MEPVFLQELAKLGPECEHEPFSPSQAQAYCKRLAESHYENFSVASLLLPRRLLGHFHAIYSYCRWADDLGDETEGGEQALRLLDWWRRELMLCYESPHGRDQGTGNGVGAPRHPVMIALQQTIRRFNIPPEPFLNLIQAFEQDQRIKVYDTYDQLVDYCKYSANPVGRLVLYLCETFDVNKAMLSDHICTGLQLANFWQDVARDYKIGRVYLPAEDRHRFGYSDEDLAANRFTPAFAELMRFEVDRARNLFEAGLPLVELVPADVQADIELFARGGLGILSKVEQIGYNVWHQRPVLTRWEKMALLAGVCLRRWRARLW